MKRFLIVVSVSIFIASCSESNTKSVIPLENDKYEVSMFGGTEESSLQSALSSARKNCDNYDKKFYIIKKNTKYVGKLDESVNNTVKTISKYTNLNFAGDGKDYKTYLHFSCK